MNICVIPARGGSKRIPRKNIKEFNGKPIIAYSIEKALRSECFGQVIVSTDDEEIANISKKYGATVPFIRPKGISDDYAGTGEVVSHAIEWLLKKDVSIDSVCCIYATAPFVTEKDIKSGLKLLNRSNADYCFTVTRYPFPVQRAIKITKENRCKMLQPDMFEKRSQDLEDIFHDAGQFYWGKPESWLENRVLFSSQSIPFVLPHYQVQDIDTMDDWRRAEYIMRLLDSDL
jgi:pseudaminic acid cytidylyltransferase